MKHCLGLLLLLSLTSAAYSASSQLFLRGSIPATFKVDTSSGTPVLQSNVKGGFAKAQLKVEKHGNHYFLTVIHP